MTIHVLHPKPTTVDWRADAACFGYDPDLWFADTIRGAKQIAPIALDVCATCPVRDACLQDALASAVSTRSPASSWKTCATESVGTRSQTAWVSRASRCGGPWNAAVTRSCRRRSAGDGTQSHEQAQASPPRPQA